MTYRQRKRQEKRLKMVAMIFTILTLILAISLAYSTGVNHRLRYEADRATCLETAMHHATNGEQVYCDEDNQLKEGE